MADREPGPSKETLHFAVVGAGVAGLACARELLAQGMRATVFERRPGCGGRLASQTWEGGICDLGAQFLTARSQEFQAQVERWLADGCVQRWDPVLAEFDKGQGMVVKATAPAYVGVPSMQSLAEHLAENLDIVFGAEVGRIARGSAEWYLFDAQDRPLGIAGFDGLVLAVPSPVALGLLRALAEFAPEAVPDLAARLEAVTWDACWSACVSLSRPSGIEFDVAFIRDDPILGWAGREGSKPGRRSAAGVAERWILQARASWSNSFPDLSPDDAGRWMQRAFAARLARPLLQKACLAVRWQHASPVGLFEPGHVWDAERRIGVAGDWCGGSSIESAFLSGQGVARSIAALPVP
jgi:predicted NAD/FAD-dependent oxidoreductase